jgi:peptide/nickel transport system permease protein
MISYIIRRILYMIPTMIIISMVCYFIIQLIPGDFLTQLRFNPRIDQETLHRYAQNLGLNKPAYIRYFIWMKNIITEGDFGYSFEYHRPVTALFLERLPITILVSIPTFMFVWLVSLPLGIYSATHQYSVGDHVFTLIGFIGLSIPNFFFALVLMYVLAVYLGAPVAGLFSQEYIGAPWSFGKLLDYLWHLWPAVLVIGTAGMAGLLRVMRGTLLDILGAEYVKTAQAKGLSERIVTYKHAVRNAINPMVSIFGQSLPGLISGALIAAIIFNIPNVERLFWEALNKQDEYLTMTLLMFFAFALILGNLLADIMLAWVDPRIRYT